MRRSKTEAPDERHDSGAAASGRPEAMPRTARFTFDERASRGAAAAAPDYLADANLFRRTYVRTIGESEGQPIDAVAAWFIGANASFHKLTSNSTTEAKRTVADAAADGIDGVVFDYVLTGRYSETTLTGTLELEAGDLGMVQSTVEIVARAHRPHMASIFLPRARLVEALGTGVSGPDFTLRRLTQAPLAAFAGGQMRLLYELYRAVSPSDFDVALESAADLLLHILRRELALGLPREEPPSDPFERALAHIEAQSHCPGLTPNTLARTVGVSRASLYKLFAGRNLTVAGYIRDLRLRRFVDALRATDEAGIGRLAWSCGFDMQPAVFTRLFKRIYGMTPRRARAALQSGREITPKPAVDF